MAVQIVISLDFELGWGHRRFRPEYVRQLRERSHEVGPRIKRLIDCFDAYEIPATWAVVGSLLENGDDPLYHRPDLFEYLLDSDVDHEIGAHSHTHPDFTKISDEEMSAEIANNKSAIEEWGISPKSFVYPLNQVSRPQLLAEYGFTHYRYDPVTTRAQRLYEHIFPRIRHPSSRSDEEPDRVPTSMFLAARHPTVLRELHARRLFHEGVKQSGGVVQFTLHPHNVVTDPNLFTFIEWVFERIHELREENEIQCVVMEGVV